MNHCGKCHHYSHGGKKGSCPVTDCRCVTGSECDCGSIMFHDDLKVGGVPV